MEAISLLTVQNVAGERFTSYHQHLSEVIIDVHDASAANQPASDSGNWSRWRFRVFLAAWILYASYYFCRKNFSVVMPMMARLEHYRTFDLANLVFIFSLAYAGGQFLAGLLADRFGARVVATGGGLLSAVCTAAMAIPGPHSMLLLLQIGNGLGQGCGWSSCLKILGAWFMRTERGTVTAWWGTSYILGGFLATVFATFTVTQVFLAPGLGWRRGFLFPAIVLAAGALFFAWRVRNRPEDAQLPNLPEDPITPSRQATWWETAKNPEVLILAGMYFFLKITRYSLLFWLPLYLVQQMQYSEQWAGYTSSLFELVGFSGALIAGYVSDRLMNGRRYPVGAVMLFGLAAALLMHPVIGRLGPVPMAMSISLLGILIYGPDLLMSATASIDAVSPEQAARAAGIVNGVGSLGQLISAYVVAVVVSRFGWDQLFTFFVICSIAAGGLLTLRWNKGVR
ncbi:MAG TPA: MFS transporter [Bryobacteraceae bacterium]|jgi:sugar phosphate permease|nr:MFS transporter [Bryobacteraceae bacterium]